MLGSLIGLLILLGCLAIAYWAVSKLPSAPIEVIKTIVLAVLGMAALVVVGRFLIGLIGSSI